MSAQPGSLWVEGTDLHFIDGGGVEWAYTGTDTGNNPTGASAGSAWIDTADDRVHYIDANGDERTLPRDAPSGVTAVNGSIWIENGLIKFVDSGSNKVAAHSDNAHSDTTHSDTHSDASHSDNTYSDNHSDESHLDSSGPFGDTAHSNTTHSDVQSHSDSIVSPHSDTSHSDTPFDDTIHSDQNHSNTHDDQITYTDSTHSDTHSDTAHSNAGHSDQPAQV